VDTLQLMYLLHVLCAEMPLSQLGQRLQRQRPASLGQARTDFLLIGLWRVPTARQPCLSASGLPGRAEVSAQQLPATSSQQCLLSAWYCSTNQ